MMRAGFVVGCLAFLSGSAALAAVNEVFVGTEGKGNATPAATVPFGMVQAGPDTTKAGDRFFFDKYHCSGYQFTDGYLARFSQTHVSGMGVQASGHFGLLPLTDGVPGRLVTEVGGEDGRHCCWEKSPLVVGMDKSTETARPGYYAVTLANGVACAMTASTFAGNYRFTYPKGSRQLLVVDADWALTGPGPVDATGADGNIWKRYVRGAGVVFDSPRTARGYQRARNYVETTLSFAARFSKPTAGTRRLREADGLRGETWVADFGVSDGTPLEVMIALSLKGQDEARRRVDAAKGFDAALTDAEAAWDDWFSRVRFDQGTDPVIGKNLRAALYHLAVQPNQVAEVGEGLEYVLFSLWDTFRAAHPFYTLVAPERVDGFMRSILAEYDSRGHLPILSIWGRDTYCMIGHHAVPVLVDAYLKGFRGFDGEKLAEAIWNSLTLEHQPESTAVKGFTKEDWFLWNIYGYYPFDLLRHGFRKLVLRGESVSRTLECAYDDACAARFFAARGDREKTAFFAKRGENWKNVFDTSVGYVRGKDSKGRWREPFDPGAIGRGALKDSDFTEGNSYQYSWHVMQDPVGLVDALGGKTKAGERLDALFCAEAKEQSYDVTGLIGQYAHGNEPSHHIGYFYAFTDRPHKTADIVRRVFETQYRPEPDGLSGNDDCGQMSAWYVFSALGFYSFDPCGGEYVLGAPQVPRGEIKVEERGGRQKTFTVIAKGLSRENKYVKAVTLNGKSVTDGKIRHADIVKGGELVFEMEAR